MQSLGCGCQFADTLGLCGHTIFTRQVLHRSLQEPKIVQGTYASDYERMGLWKLGNGRPEPSESVRLLQQLFGLHLLIDVSTGSEQHQSFLALGRDVRTVPIAGEFPSPREELSKQWNPIDVRGRKLVPQPRMPKPQVSQLVADNERQGVLVLLVGVAEQLAVDHDEIVAKGRSGECVEFPVARNHVDLRVPFQA